MEIKPVSLLVVSSLELISVTQRLGNSATQRLGNTVPKKHDSGSEPLATLGLY